MYIIIATREGLYSLYLSLVRTKCFNVCVPTDSRRRCDSQVLDLEQHVNVRCELDTFAVSQTQHLVVVEHRVHILNPQRIHGTVTDHPLMGLRRLLNIQANSDIFKYGLNYQTFLS